MRACGALACAARAHGAAVVVCYKWGLLTACVLVPLLQGGSDQDFLHTYTAVRTLEKIDKCDESDVKLAPE